MADKNLIQNKFLYKIHIYCPTTMKYVVEKREL